MSWNSAISSLFSPYCRAARKPSRRRRALLLVETLERRLTPSTGEIHGTVWNDLNGNALHDANEPGIAGRTVYLDQNRNDALDPGEVSTVTASDGSYAFTNLTLGSTYYVAEVLPGGWQQSSPGVSSGAVAATEWPITLNAQQTATITFNNFASTATQLIPGPYSEAGYSFDTSTNSTTKFRIFGSTDTGYYQGAPALSSQWAPVTISLKRSADTTPFTLSSIDLSGYTVGSTATVTFTGTHTDGTTVQQTCNVTATQGFQTFAFANFTNLKLVTWSFTGFSDYHQFRNVVLQTGGTPIATNVNFDTVQMPLPSLSVSDAQFQEGNSGTTYANFTVLLSQQNPYPVTVHYTTADGTAKAGTDYGAVTGAVTIEANQRYRVVQVPIYGNTTVEPDKTFTVQLFNPTNATLAQATATGTIVNDDPLQANADAYSVNENTSLTVAAPGVLSNDTPAANEGPLSAQLSTGPAHGTVTFNSDGSFTYTPQTNFYGTDSFQYRDLEGTLPLRSNLATVTITINHVDQPPVANNDSYTVNEDQTLTVSAVPGTTSLTMNSQPGDYIGQGKTYGYTSASGKFTVSRNYDNGVSFSYTSALNPGTDWWYVDFAAPNNQTLVPGVYNNAARFPFQSANQPGLDVSGQGRGSNTLTGSFNVLQAVYAADGSVVSFDATFVQYSDNSTGALTGEIKYNAGATPSGILANDTDPDGDALTAVLVSGAAHGTLALNANGTFTYTPAANFNGTDSFTYLANDGQLNSNVATVTITVNPVNDAPTFTGSGDVTVPENAGPQTVAGWAQNISAGPPDEAGQTLTFLVSNDNNALFAVRPSLDPNTGNLTFAAAGDAVGSATVTVLLHDNGGTANGGQDTSTPVTFHIYVNNVPPAFTAPANQTANEVSSQSFALGSFTDPGAGPWSVSVDWGDGTTPSTFSVTSAGALPAQAHTYGDTGTYTAKVTVTDNYQAASSGTFQVAVASVNPTFTPPADQAASEGSSSSIALGSFTDPDPDSPWNVAVNWGDGTAPTTFATSSTGLLGNQAHLYATYGTYTVTVSVTNADQAPSSGVFHVVVANVPPAITPPANQSANEQAASTFALGSFADPGADGPWSVSVDWGDGSAPASFSMTGTGTIPTQTHLYADAGTYTVTESVTDQGQAQDSKTFQVTVATVPPTLTPAANQASNEGATTSFALGSFTDPDPDSPWSVAVNWGDNSTSTTFTTSSTGALPNQTHVYADNGTYTVTVTVANKDQDQDSKTFQVAVANVPPAVTAPANQTSNEGAATSFALGSFTDPGPDAPWTVSVNWGDGSAATTFTTSSTGTIPSQSHSYADNGTYTVTVSVTDKDQGQGSQTFQVAVANVPPAVTAPANQKASEGSPASFALGSFTDPGPDAPWNVVVNWGDGSTSSFTTSATGSLGSLAHRYADEGTYTASVSVTDKDQGSGSGSFTVTVADVPPAVSFSGPSTGVRGQTRAFSGRFTDPGADTWTATVNYGDGSGNQPLTLNADKTFNFSHAYPTAGSYTITVAVTDDDGATGSFSQAVTVKAVDIQPDPLNAGRSVLMVAGTTGSDTIQVNPGSSSGQYTVTINGVNQGTFTAPTATPFARIEVHGLAGDDTITVSSKITLPGWLYGEDGNDNLTGGAGSSVLLGGNGNDTLTGGSGRDLLIGGQGADTLNGGGGGNNILIAGYTSFDDNQAALEAVMLEWTSARDYTTRVKDLTDGSGSTSRLNGNVYLQAGVTVFNDAYVNTLITSSSYEWLFYDATHDRIRKH